MEDNQNSDLPPIDGQTDEKKGISSAAVSWENRIDSQLESDLPKSGEKTEIRDRSGSGDSSTYTVRLEAFEGPLDLLLHLIREEKIDIWDIPIARITEQYLAYLRKMDELNLHVAGDFVMMAATLIYIKSKMLLPPDPTKTEEQLLEEDPRKELVYQLLEHQKFKEAAQVLYSKETVESCVWSHPPTEIEESEDDVVLVTLFDVVKAFHKILARLEEQPGLELMHEEVTIEQKIDEIRKLLVLHGSFHFSEFLGKSISKRHLIVAFLAILELTRQAEVYFSQSALFGDILVHAAKPKASDMDQVENAVLDFRTEES